MRTVSLTGTKLPVSPLKGLGKVRPADLQFRTGKVVIEREHRRRVLKGASILSGLANSEITCTIRDMTANGAKISAPADASVPDEFLLYVPVDGIGYRATVAWRRGDSMGLCFSGTEPKPSWHYG